MYNSISPFQVIKERTVEKKHPGILTCMTILAAIAFVMLVFYIIRGVDWLCGIDEDRTFKHMRI